MERGLGGTVKQLEARASLQRPYNDQVMTPQQLFDWAYANLPAVHFEYCSSTREQSSLEQYFALSRTIPGTRKLLSLSDSTVQVKHYSTSDISRKE